LTEKEIKAGHAKSDKNEAVKFLVDATLENGAPDNVSVVIADIVEATDGETEFFGAASDK
jgi:serine/threonine protein phosphatase PrpC